MKQTAPDKPQLTNPAVRRMILPWLTGDDENDARHFARRFRMIGFTLAEWRRVIAESKPAPVAPFTGKARLIQCVEGEFVRTEVSMANVEIAFAVRGFEKSGLNFNPGNRAELQGAPRFAALYGPMWDGDAIRYEDCETYDRMSA